jgi:hypothetical protein
MDVDGAGSIVSLAFSTYSTVFFSTLLFYLNNLNRFPYNLVNVIKIIGCFGGKTFLRSFITDNKIKFKERLAKYSRL